MGGWSVNWAFLLLSWARVPEVGGQLLRRAGTPRLAWRTRGGWDLRLCLQNSVISSWKPEPWGICICVLLKASTQISILHLSICQHHQLAHLFVNPLIIYPSSTTHHPSTGPAIDLSIFLSSFPPCIPDHHGPSKCPSILQPLSNFPPSPCVSGPWRRLWEYSDDRTVPHSPVAHSLVGMSDVGAILKVMLVS